MPTTITTTRPRRAALSLVLVLAAVASCAPPPRTTLHPRYAEPIGQIHVRRGRLSWGALAIGMGFQEVQRVLGRRLPTPSEALGCGYREVEAEVQDQRLVLQFEGGGETGRLAAIALVFPGAPARDLAATLEARFPDLEHVPGRHAPDPAEVASPKPLYRLPEEKGGGLFFIDPRVGLWLGLVCVD